MCGSDSSKIAGKNKCTYISKSEALEIYDNMSYILDSLGYVSNLKYYRTRSRAKLEYGIELYLDYIVGYGYIIEVVKDVQDESKIDLTKIELGNFLESLDINVMSEKELDKRREEYVLNWDMLTRNVNEKNFLK